MQLAASLIGVIGSKIKFTQDGCQFSLKTDNGVFFIKIPDREQVTICKTLCAKGMRVHIVAQPHSFVAKCSSHHVYFKASSIIPVDQSDSILANASVSATPYSPAPLDHVSIH